MSTQWLIVLIDYMKKEVFDRKCGAKCFKALKGITSDAGDRSLHVYPTCAEAMERLINVVKLGMLEALVALFLLRNS